MIRPDTDCVYCHAAVIEVDGRWEHFVPDDIVSDDGYYTYLTCDPLLFDDRVRRVATPTVATS